MILLLTGSPASGKTTIANILQSKYDFQLLDGDQLIKDLGLTSKSWNQIHEEIFKRSISLHWQKNVVISHVVLPDTFERYIDHFNKHSIEFKIVVLKPQIETLLARNTIRTSHPKPTPIEYIHYFDEKYNKQEDQSSNLLIMDNTDQTPESTAELVVSYVENKKI